MLKRIIFSATHIIFWIVFIALSLEFSFNVSGGWGFFYASYDMYFLNVTWALCAVYLFYFFISPFLLIQRKAFKYLLFSIVLSPVVSTLFFGLFYLIFEERRMVLQTKLYLGSTIVTFILFQVGTLIRAFVNWYNEQESKSELEKINLSNELTMLRSQINPHFLFNTLNNIDALVHANPALASKAIIMLSDMMRYMLYETDQEYVTLGQEKKYLDDLIALQRLRHKSKDEIIFTAEINNQDSTIIPFLFLPFVENAFKFATKVPDNPLVKIKLIEADDGLCFSCRNYFMPAQYQTTKTSGLGLRNVKCRLEKIYPESHSLQLVKGDGSFEVELKIKYEH